MNEINLRSATLNDLPTLLEFEQGIIAAERPFDPTLRSGHINYYDLKEKIKSSTTEVMVAVLEEEVVGSAYIEITQAKPFQNFETYGYVGFMFVKPEYRGKGVSQKIIEGLKSWAKSKSLNEIRLEVYDDNERAVRAYEKAGFKKNLVEMRIGI